MIQISEIPATLDTFLANLEVNQITEEEEDPNIATVEDDGVDVEVDQAL